MRSCLFFIVPSSEVPLGRRRAAASKRRGRGGRLAGYPLQCRYKQSSV